MHLSSTRVTAHLSDRWCASGLPQKSARWQKCNLAVILSKIVLCMSARLSKNIFARIRTCTSNGEYLPGPTESVSIALVDGISPSDFRNRVRMELTYVEGWKKQPNAVLRRMIDQAEAWKIVEAHGSSSGSSGGAARSGARQEKKQSAKGLTCHKCGEVGPINGTATRVESRFGARAPTAILFGAVNKVSAVVGRDAAVGLTGVVAAVEILSLIHI